MLGLTLVLLGDILGRAVVEGGGDLISDVLARDAAVPCISRDVEGSIEARAGGDLTGVSMTEPGAGLGLPESRLNRVPAAFPSEALFLFSVASGG